MLVKKLIPIKFVGLMIQIILSSQLLATKELFPSLGSVTDAT
jgi:hypothetical protein